MKIVNRKLLVRAMKLIFVSVILVFAVVFVNANEIQKKIYTTQKTSTPPVIDGHLDKDVWGQVAWGGDFVQHTPNEGEAPSQKTVFKILYDDNNLYVFIKAYDTEVDKISQLLSRRDNFTGDFVEINIDSDFDKQTAFSFSAMASGVKGDEMITQDGRNWDTSWDPIWFLKTSVDDEGWNAEFRIPFSQLRFGDKEKHVWGIQVMRHFFRKEERSRWQYIPQDAPGFVHLFGELHGIKDIKPKRQFDILPYSVAKFESYPEEEGNPYTDGKDFSMDVGVDGKIAVTNDLTLDFTINPDFGQVEADPSEVNLSAFESYFSERRPFFIEGKSIFDYRPSHFVVINDLGQDNLFYSRRIGRFPHYSPDVDYVDSPDATTIISAFKLSGKTKKGLSIGIMESITAEENAKISDGINEHKETVEPFTNYFAARLKQDINKGKTTIGGMITAVNRDIGSSDEIFELPRAAYTGGIDFMHYWKDRTYYIGLNYDFSHIRGNKNAILSLQESSARYFQRPDAGYVDLDEDRKILTGTAAAFKFGKRGNGKWQFESSLAYRSPEFELNDIGYMRSADLIHAGAWAGYYVRKPFWIFENFYLNHNVWVSWNFDGKLLDLKQNINFNTKLKVKWSGNGSITHIGESYSVSALRGGPALKYPDRWSYNLNVDSDNRKKLNFYFGFWKSRGLEKWTKDNEYWAGFTYRPANALKISVSGFYNTMDRELYYVDQLEVADDTKYVFARLNQKTLGFTLRVNYSITPDLSIQYYGQPFVSAGDYTEFKLINDSKADSYTNRFDLFLANQISYDPDEEMYLIDEDGDEITDYEFDQPDYNFVQFKSNLVIRWEYLPGSTVYLVWSQGRSYSTTNGTFDFNDNINDLFSVQPSDIFLVKFSYRFSL